jgi:predicted oxidoreductase
MKHIPLGTSTLQVPNVAVGCMRIAGKDLKTVEKFLKTSIDLGANFFDHADIYGGGESESLFARALPMSSAVRETVILQSKCGIVPGKMFDFSKEHILSSVDGILKRLQTEYLDVLLLHRPDALMEPEEVDEAFTKLKDSGKVRYFGVSNQKPSQIELMTQSLHVPIVANQLQLSITNSQMIGNGMHVNMGDDTAINRDGDILDYCRLKHITIQPWSPLQHGFFAGVFLDEPSYGPLNDLLKSLAKQYSVTPTAIAFAWLSRHPAKFQPVTGTTNVERLEQCIQGTQLELSRQEWYDIWKSAGNILP